MSQNLKKPPPFSIIKVKPANLERTSAGLSRGLGDLLRRSRQSCGTPSVFSPRLLRPAPTAPGLRWPVSSLTFQAPRVEEEGLDWEGQEEGAGEAAREPGVSRGGEATAAPGWPLRMVFTRGSQERLSWALAYLFSTLSLQILSRESSGTPGIHFPGPENPQSLSTCQLSGEKAGEGEA